MKKKGTQQMSKLYENNNNINYHFLCNWLKRIDAWITNEFKWRDVRQCGMIIWTIDDASGYKECIVERDMDR